jgi:hypothetical protein
MSLARPDAAREEQSLRRPLQRYRQPLRPGGGTMRAVLRSQSHPTWVIWLEQRADLYNPPVVSGFQWRTLPAHSVPDARCKSLPRAATVSLPVSIRLGQSRAAIRNVMGSPTTEYAQVLVFTASQQRKIIGTSSAHTFTELETIAISFDNGKVAAIDVYKSTTD